MSNYTVYRYLSTTYKYFVGSMFHFLKDISSISKYFCFVMLNGYEREIFDMFGIRVKIILILGIFYMVMVLLGFFYIRIFLYQVRRAIF